MPVVMPVGCEGSQDERSHSRFPEAEESCAAGYYAYDEERIPFAAITKSQEYRRWRRHGVLAGGFCVALTTLLMVLHSLWLPPSILPLAQFWVLPSDGVWSWNVKTMGDNNWDALFREFFVRFGKQREYSLFSPEYYKRLETFKRNARWISEHNKNVESLVIQDVALAPNQFMDMDWSEFRQRHLSPSAIVREEKPEFSPTRIDGGRLLGAVSNHTLPESVNWVTKGCVTPVKDQAHWIVSLSEQQLMDCAGPEGTRGCHGGFMDNAFQYVIDNKGLCSEEAYPYEGVDSKECRAKSCKSEVKVKGILDLPPHDDKALQAGIALYGPVSVAIEADRPVFQFYHKGVMNLKCGKHLNHAVLAVGYGKDESAGENYWLVKNSWGTTWGDNGYIRLTRDKRIKNGECGILLAPVLPIIEVGSP